MFNKKLAKIFMVCIFLFIISFGLSSSVYAEDSLNNENQDNINEVNSIEIFSVYNDPDAYDDSDDDSDDYDDYDDNYDEDDEDLEDYFNYYEFEWKGNIYFIDLDQFNLTDEELTELFTKRDALMEEIDDLEFLIQEMETSRNNDTLLAIDTLYDSINNIINNTEFNDLLLSLKDINITELNSTFNELKELLESIKINYLSEDFTEIDLLMDDLETLINEDLERYENLSSQLNEKLAELFKLFEEYPFLMDHTKYAYHVPTIGDVDGVPDDSYEKFKKVSAKMKNTGIPYFSLAILVLIFGLSIFNIKRRF